MNAKAFLKENAVLAAGITLPLLLALLFWAATVISRSAIDPPQYPVLYAEEYSHYRSKDVYRFFVDDGTLYYQYYPVEQNENASRLPKAPKLYLYDPAEDAEKQIDLPAVRNIKEKLDVAVPALEGMTIDAGDRSPDGFVFTNHGRSRGNSNLMTELFGGGSRYGTSYALEKDSVRFEIPDTQGRRYPRAQFIGWVTDEEQAQ